MMASRLMVVLLAARLAALWGRPLAMTGWLPLALLWQDVLIVLLFLVVERLLRGRWPVYLIYAAVAAITVVNVPAQRVLNSPVTAPMLRAARGALNDSFRHHASPDPLVPTLTVLLLAVAVPFVRRKTGGAPSSSTARASAARADMRVPVMVLRAGSSSQLGLLVPGIGAAALALLGPLTAQRAETGGAERNAIMALARSALPRVHARAAHADWRASPFVPDGDTSTSALAIGVSSLESFRGAAAGHNVLLVVLESTAAQYLASYGAGYDVTPNLSALASRSMVFENAYAVYPESIKGLVALLASRYPAFDRAAEQHAPLMRSSLATRLQGAGYTTALFHSGRFMYLGMAELLAGAGFHTLADAGTMSGNMSSSFGITEAEAVVYMLRWLDDRPAGQPFFMAYLPIAGHHPYATRLPGPYEEHSDFDRYRNALHEGDIALGQLLAGLHARGLERNTLVIITGDHGEAFGQHSGNYGHNLALYEENVRVPLLFYWPAMAGKERRVPNVASVLDVAPTALDLLALPVPAAFQGESRLNEQQRMALFFTDYSLGLLGLRDGCLKAIHELESSRTRLFDLCRDAGEHHDLAADFAQRLDHYRDRLRAWSGAQVALLGR